jgi:hypothetical protein
LQPFEYSVSADEVNEADKPKPIRCANIESGRTIIKKGIKMAEIIMLNYNMVSAHQVPVCEPDSATGLY